MSAKQFTELRLYEQVETFGERRLDERFALLAAAIVNSAGSRLSNGQTYTTRSYLEQLSGYRVEPVVSRQTTEEMEIHLKGWMDASNMSRRERGLHG